MTKFSVVSTTILISLLFSLQTAFAASTKDEVLALQKEVEELKQGQDSMKSELSAIRKLLEEGSRPQAQKPAPKPFEPVDLTVSNAPYMGENTARVTLIEYSDYQCPYCKRHFLNTMPALKENYIDTGKLKFIMREFPLTSIHPQAVVASMAALCAKDQGNYWGMHDILFANQKKLDSESIKSYGETIGLDQVQFLACMDDGKYRDRVQKDLEEGQGLGIRGTPSFAIGLTDPNDSGKVKVMKVIRGAAKYESFASEIEGMLNSADEAKNAP